MTAATSTPTLYGSLRTWADAAPQRELLIQVDPVPDEHRERGGTGGPRRAEASAVSTTVATAEELLALADSRAAWMQGRGIGPGSCIAVWLPSWIEAVAWQFAASAVGAHVIGVNTRYNVAEVGHVLRKARPSVLVAAHGFQRLDLLRTLTRAAESLPADAPRPFVLVAPAPNAPTPPRPEDWDLGAGSATTLGMPRPDAGASASFRLVTTGTQQGTPSPAERTGGAASVQDVADDDRDVLAVAFTTSGSTGMPKLAAHSEAGTVAHLQAVAARLEFRTGDVMVEPLPYSGTFGYTAVMAALFGGASVVIQPAFDPAALLEVWHACGGTHYVGGDDMLVRIAQAWRERPYDLSTWRWTGVADFQGASHEIARWSADRFGTTTVGVYGSSEVFALTSFWPSGTAAELRARGGGQLASPSYAYRIADPATDAEVPAGERGEIQLRGPNVVDAYLGDEGEGAKAFTGDGWFRSGDLGDRVDEHSFAYVCRMGDVLRLKGFMVDPAEIEGHIAGHPAVDTAKVVGRTGRSGETEAVAFVVLAAGAEVTGDELRDYTRESLARYKVPAEVRIVEEMPTTAGTNGSKIRAVTLREWAQLPSSPC
jgi:acyl-CoA synthetase (AMP-forming)/AMP-acid ligase II